MCGLNKNLAHTFIIIANIDILISYFYIEYFLTVNKRVHMLYTSITMMNNYSS